MSILIKGMEMPKCCNDCRFAWIDTDHHWYCEANKPWGLDITDHVMSKHPDCPLIAVPPHGRLVDADALLVSDHQHYNYIADEFYVEVRTIENAPTVIEASEVE